MASRAPHRFGWLRLAAAALLVLPLHVASAPSQDVDPFVEPAATPPPGTDPFGGTPSTEPGKNPFDLPPTAVPTPIPGSDPFSATPAPGQGSNPFDLPAAKPANPFDDTATIPAAAPTTAPPTAPTAAQGEIKALMVLSTEAGFQSVEQIQQLAKDCRDAGFTRVYIEARTAFGVAFASRIEKPMQFINPTFPNPVAELRRALPPGTEIFAVVSLLPSYSALVGSRPAATHIFGNQPDFIAQSVTGAIVAPDNRIHLDPGNPDAVFYLRGVLEEIDSVLAPDGYLFTGVGYPGAEWGYSPVAVSRFRGVVGGQGNPLPDDPTWSSWRRARVSDLIGDVRDTIQRARPGTRVGVMVGTGGAAPPATWEQWIESPSYSRHMTDWLSWCQDSRLDELTIEISERISAQGNILDEWVAFLNKNKGPVVGLISVSGGHNFLQGLSHQFSTTRSRGLGTILSHYAQPVRGSSRGFYSSLPNTIFSGASGRPVPGEPLKGERESRQFGPMDPPPPEAPSTKSTPVVVTNPLENRPLKFSTPTPVPTLVQERAVVPEAITRKVYLKSGMMMEAVVTEITDTSITLEPTGSGAVVISRSAVARIEPPL